MNKLPPKIPATAFILIGGKSKRFGSLKWQTTLNGKTILERIWDACDGIGNRYVIGKKKPDSISYPFIKDELEINAPINGLYTALKYSKTDWILLLSCDLPLIDSKVFNKFLKRNKTAPGLTGWAQIHGFRGNNPSNTHMVKRMEYDLWYMNNWSIWLDLYIILKDGNTGYF